MSLVTSPPRRSARKAKGDGHLRRAEILEAAERIFVAEGYDGATIRKIADEVGVSSTALYMHFQDKGAILLEICEATLKALLDRNRELAARPVDPVVRVRMMMEAYVRWGLEHSPPATAPVSEGTEDMGSQCYATFAGVVAEVAAVGRLRSGSPDSAAQAMWMSCHGVVALMTARPAFGWADRDELISVTLDGLLHGLVVD